MQRIPAGRPRPLFDAMHRRAALRLGTVGLLGGLGLPSLLERASLLERTSSLDGSSLLAAEAHGANRTAKAQACILLFLEGGPSTVDMWDLKPEAPSEIRGPFQPIATKVPGIHVGEHCHLSARVADKFSIVRSHTHEDNGHVTGYYYAMTGQRAKFRDGQNSRIPVNVLFPSLGSRVARELGIRGAVPPYVNLPAPMDAGGPGFYGPRYAPFVIESDPVQPDFEVKDLRLPGGVSSARMDRRREMLTGIEQLGRPGDGRAREMAAYYEKARDLITSPAAQKAFDIQSESAALRLRYGHSTIGQSALLARRMVEAGSRFVGIDHPGWDTHVGCFPTLQDDLIPQADRAFSALVTDLDERGLLDTTLVVMMGEMGRAPRVNKDAGRDHWSKAQSILIAGGGTRPGQVIGATDKHASEPTRDPVSIQDLHYTIFNLMGIDTKKTYHTPLGRPVPICGGGKMIPGLV